MASTLQNPSDCCSTCPDEATTQIPGPQGEPGTDGAAGTNGINAYTVTTASFVVPAVNSNVTVAGVQFAWMANGQKVFIQFAGYYEVQSVPSSTSVILKNLGYDGNMAPTTVIPLGVTVSPAGLKGADGSLTGTAGGQLEGTYPNPTIAVTTTKGDLLVNQNAAVAPRMTRLGAGANGTVLHSDSTQATGLIHRAIDLTGVATLLSGALPVANGGTGAATDANARTNLGAAKSGANVDITSLGGLTTPLSLAQGGVGSATAAGARANLGKVLPRYGMLGRVTGVNANAANTDNAVAMEASRYRIDKVTVDNGSINLTTGTVGVFTNPAGAGTAIAADQPLSALTASTKFEDLTLEAVIATDVLTAGTIYVRTGTAQGAASTFDCYIFGWSYDA